MAKKIILLSDGTGNSAAKQNKTNVWRLYDALNLHLPDQIAFYDDGVGSQEFLPLKLIGCVFGYGLKTNVRQLYKFLCHTYRPGDKIYMFGFSRGAFTIRMLLGMIDSCGICTEFHDEQELDQIARHNYNAYRSKFKSGYLTRLIRIGLGVNSCYQGREHHKPEIEFIGLWDTVDAYGLPFDELAWLWDKLIYPMYFPNHKLSPRVKKACHALSIDDERRTFHPVLWDERDEVDPDRIEQVWFPGVHSDVGGGYPEYSLALVALEWMLTKVEAVPGQKDGLQFIENQRKAILCHSDWHGKHHDSRALFGVYYLYEPRKIKEICNPRDGSIKTRKPKIHRSVFERIQGNVVPYAPIGLPEEYEVVGFDNNVIQYEDESQAKDRYGAQARINPIITARKRLHRAIVFTTLLYIASPFLLKSGCIGDSACVTINGMVDKLLGIIAGLAPGILYPWIGVLQENPLCFYLLVILFGLFFVLKSRLWVKTQLLANEAWAKLKEGGRNVWRN